MINIHYCMGRLASVEYGVGDHDACNKCGMKEKKGCCHTESTFLKIQDDHQLAKTVKVPEFAIAAEPLLPVYQQLLFDEVKVSAIQYADPPDPRSGSILLHISVFRI